MKNKNQYIQTLLQTENEQLDRLHKIIQEAITEESMLTSKIAGQGSAAKDSFGDRLADRVAAFGGSWFFIIFFMSVLLAWIVLNSFILLNRGGFDPYPFILLNLILSCIAALQAPVIMMSQNRQETKDRQRAENDYLINLKAEIEIRNLHRKIDLSVEEQFQHLCAIQQKQIELLESIEKRLNERRHAQ